jgi:hypothetical protein
VSDRLEELTAALEDGAARLRRDELDAEAAATLVEECARLAGDAAAELERRTRAAAVDPEP